MSKIMCDCCDEKEAVTKDYRFIEGYFQGKCFMCKDCFNLSDVEVVKIIDRRGRRLLK